MADRKKRLFGRKLSYSLKDAVNLARRKRYEEAEVALGSEIARYEYGKAGRSDEDFYRGLLAVYKRTYRAGQKLLGYVRRAGDEKNPDVEEIIYDQEEYKKGIKDIKKKLLHKRTDEGGLEKTFSFILAIIGALGALFFFSANITGAATGNLNQTSSNVIGVCFLAIGLIAGYFWMKNR